MCALVDYKRFINILLFASSTEFDFQSPGQKQINNISIRPHPDYYTKLNIYPYCHNSFGIIYDMTTRPTKSTVLFMVLLCGKSEVLLKC
jgi:hypothetical protein